MRRLTWRRHGFWVTAILCVGLLTVLSVVLYAVPPKTAAPVPQLTLESLNWTILQGNSTMPAPWFAEASINQSGSEFGFPYVTPAGKAFNDSLVLVNILLVDVPVCSVTVEPPLFILATDPSVPFFAEKSEDNLLVLTILVDASAGTTIRGFGTVSALGCSLPP
jgi:hypothetical protein